MEGGAVGHNFEMGLPKGYPGHIWFSGFRENMSNLHNLYKSVERKIPQKNSDYMVGHNCEWDSPQGPCLPGFV